MRTVIVSFGWDCVLIILFQLCDRAGLFESNLFWVGQCDLCSIFILEEELLQYWYNLIQFTSNLSKIIPDQKSGDVIL